MTLPIGTRLGSFELTGTLGSGGMGEVYRAHDTKLNRDVALKVLPDNLLDDDRLARFRREAQAVAALNHPNVAAIYGFEDSLERPTLVLELVEGPTLADRVAQGPIPIDEAVAIARQIADALEAAHEQGIVHRDLKPANVKLRPDGVVKVLDFGLAKLTESSVVRTSADPTLSPTITSPAMTGVGVILGTAAYMAPEQAAGKAADKRADIWSFGVVLWEMLTGERLFGGGESTSHILADVLRAPIDFDKVPAGPLRDLLRRCLDRNVKTRLRDIGEARVTLSRPLVPPAEPGITAGGTAQIRARVAWTAAAVFAFAAGIALWALWRGQPSPLLARLPVDLGSDVALANPPGGAASNTVVISRDGSRLAFIASVGDGPQRVHVRRIDTIADTPPLALPGTDGATGLAFSPDGQSLAFTAGARVYRISVDGGAALRLADVVGPNGRSPTQVTWGDGDDVIVSGVALGLYRVRSSGGAAVAVTELLGSEFTHTSAQILPGGKTVLFMVGLTGDDTARIEAVPISGGMRKVIIRNGGSPFYIPTGHLLYVRQTTLFAVRFDPDTLQTIGDAVPLVTDVKTTRAGLLAMGFYDAANNGSLIYRKASDSSALPLFAGSGIESIDLAGKRHRFRIDAASRYFAPRVSPDGDRIALNVLGLAGSMVPEVSVYDIRREDQTKIVSAGGVSLNPTWVPPRGRYLIFTKLVGVSRSELQWKPADGGQPQPLLPAVRVSAGGSFRGDGRKLAFVSFGSSVGGRGTETGRRIFTADVTESDGQLKAGVPELFSPSQFNEFDPEFSPDGRWMAFVTDKSDQNEVWIRAVTSADRKAQASEVKVSSNGGESPRWSANSRQLLYRAGEQILAVSVASDGDGLIVDKPQVRVDKLGGAPPAFDLTRDGRIVIATAVDAPKAPAEHTVVLLQNFFDEVRRRVK